MAPVAGVGYLCANDILTDCAFYLFQPSVNTTVPAIGISTGSQIVAVWDSAMYVGAQLVVGSIGSSDVEVVTITATTPGTSFTATFANPHTAGEPITGATFPVRQGEDAVPMFTQAEMLAYLSAAVNDFLTEVPLVYNVNEAVTVGPSQQNTALPADCMFPVRAAYNPGSGLYPLRETSQSNLDSIDQNWSQAGVSTPQAYFRDKIPTQNIGIWPRAMNSVTLEVVYAQRQAQTLGLADGFLLPDPFLTYVLCRTLEFAFSKDGEMRSPALAKYFGQRYATGVKVATMVLDSVNDQNLQTAQG